MRYFYKLLGIFGILVIQYANNGEAACLWRTGVVCDPCKAQCLNDQIKQQLKEYPKVYDTKLELEETFNTMRYNLESAMIKKFLAHDGCEEAALALEKFQKFVMQYNNVKDILESLIRKLKKWESDPNLSENEMFEVFRMTLLLEDSATIDAARAAIRITRKFLEELKERHSKNENELKDSNKHNDNDKKVTDKDKASDKEKVHHDKDKARLKDLLQAVQEILAKLCKQTDKDKDEDEDNDENAIMEVPATDSKELEEDNMFNAESAEEVNDNDKEVFDKETQTSAEEVCDTGTEVFDKETQTSAEEVNDTGKEVFDKETQTSAEEVCDKDKATLKDLLKAVEEILAKINNLIDKDKDKCKDNDKDKDENTTEEMLVIDSEKIDNMFNAETMAPQEIITTILEYLNNKLKIFCQNKLQEGDPLYEQIKVLQEKIESIIKEFFTPKETPSQPNATNEQTESNDKEWVDEIETNPNDATNAETECYDKATVDEIIDINKQIDRIFLEYPRKPVENIKLNQIFNEKRSHLFDCFLQLSATANDIAEAKKAIAEFKDFIVTYNVVIGSVEDAVERLKWSEKNPNLCADVKYKVRKCRKEIEMSCTIDDVNYNLKNCEKYIHLY